MTNKILLSAIGAIVVMAFSQSAMANNDTPEEGGNKADVTIGDKAFDSTVNITQAGLLNAADVDLAGGPFNTANITQTGDSGIANIRSSINLGGNNLGEVFQEGLENEATLYLGGSNNSMTTTQNGRYGFVEGGVLGSDNKVNHTSTINSFRDRFEYRVAGERNTVNVTQGRQ